MKNKFIKEIKKYIKVYDKGLISEIEILNIIEENIKVMVLEKELELLKK